MYQQFLHSKHILSTNFPDLRFMLVLQDAVDHNNDLGRKTFAWRHIQATFKAGHDALLEAISASNEDAEVSPEEDEKKQQQHKERKGSLLAPLVGGCHERFLEGRRKAEEFGQLVLEREAVARNAGEGEGKGPEVENVDEKNEETVVDMEIATETKEILEERATKE
jgi:DNA polymerase sigma